MIQNIQGTGGITPSGLSSGLSAGPNSTISQEDPTTTRPIIGPMSGSTSSGSTAPRQGEDKPSGEEGQDEYKSPVMAALQQVNSLLEKAGKSLPGFGGGGP